MSKSDREIDLSDIPEITDVSNARKNPFAEKMKNGYSMIVEHGDYEEVITISKTRRPKAYSAVSEKQNPYDK